MEPAEFQAWLGGGNASDTPAAAGEKLFQEPGLLRLPSRRRARPRRRSSGDCSATPSSCRAAATVVADEAYIRESIVQSRRRRSSTGFQPIMPTFQGLVTEEQLLQLIAYVRSLGEAEPAAAPARSAARAGSGQGMNIWKP